MIRKRIVVLVMFFLVLIVLFVLFNNGIFNQREENTQNEVIFYANSEIIEEMKVTDWEYNQKTRTIKFNNKENIVSATLAAELDDGTIFEGSLFDYIGKDVSEYTFPEKGYFEIKIETPGVKHSPIVINNE